MRSLVALLLLVALMGLAAPAPAQVNPFGPVPTEEPEPIEDPNAPQETSRSTLLLVVGAVVLGLGAIGYAIARDARRSAPGDPVAAAPARRERDPDAAPGAVSREARARARKARAKAKAARRQRKRTPRR